MAVLQHDYVLSHGRSPVVADAIVGPMELLAQDLSLSTASLLCSRPLFCHDQYRLLLLGRCTFGGTH